MIKHCKSCDFIFDELRLGKINCLKRKIVIWQFDVWYLEPWFVEVSWLPTVTVINLLCNIVAVNLFIAVADRACFMALT